jgi:hypothetical protein
LLPPFRPVSVQDVKNFFNWDNIKNNSTVLIFMSALAAVELLLSFSIWIRRHQASKQRQAVEKQLLDAVEKAKQAGLHEEIEYLANFGWSSIEDKTFSPESRLRTSVTSSTTADSDDSSTQLATDAIIAQLLRYNITENESLLVKEREEAAAKELEMTSLQNLNRDLSKPADWLNKKPALNRPPSRVLQRPAWGSGAKSQSSLAWAAAAKDAKMRRLPSITTELYQPAAHEESNESKSSIFSFFSPSSAKIAPEMPVPPMLPPKYGLNRKTTSVSKSSTLTLSDEELRRADILSRTATRNHSQLALEQQASENPTAELEELEDEPEAQTSWHTICLSFLCGMINPTFMVPATVDSQLVFSAQMLTVARTEISEAYRSGDDWAWFTSAKTWSLVRSNVVHNILSSHPMFSVLYHHPLDNYSTYQRMLVLFCMLYTVLAVNASFFQQRGSSIGTDVLIAFYTSLIVSPVGLLFPYLFLHGETLHVHEIRESIRSGVKTSCCSRSRALLIFSHVFCFLWSGGAIFMVLVYAMQFDLDQSALSATIRAGGMSVSARWLIACLQTIAIQWFAYAPVLAAVMITIHTLLARRGIEFELRQQMEDEKANKAAVTTDAARRPAIGMVSPTK